jgi:hypothetical protein
MKRILKLLGALCLGPVGAFAAVAASPQFISGPNEYYFIWDTYEATATPTNVMIAVGLGPGDPSWTGSCEYWTADGTAIAGRDYTAVEGGLTFSGPSWRYFAVPVARASSPEDKTVSLNVNEISGRHSMRPHATLIIRGSPQPPLSIAPQTNNIIRLSWPSAYTNYVAECSGVLPATQGQWTQLGTPVRGKSRFVVDYRPAQKTCFFRLRQTQ